MGLMPVKKAAAGGEFLVPPTPRLAAALSTAEKAMATRSTLAGRIVETRQAIVEAQRATERVRQKIEDTAELPSTDNALEFAEKKAIAEAGEMRLLALERAETAAIQELKERLAEVEAARFEWREQVLCSFAAEYRAAAEVMSAAIRKLYALSEAVGDLEGNPLWRSLRENRIFWPGEERSILNVSRSQYNETGGSMGTGATETVPIWREDPAALALFERHRGALECERALKREIQQFAAADVSGR